MIGPDKVFIIKGAPDADVDIDNNLPALTLTAADDDDKNTLPDDDDAVTPVLALTIAGPFNDCIIILLFDVDNNILLLALTYTLAVVDWNVDGPPLDITLISPLTLFIYTFPVDMVRILTPAEPSTNNDDDNELIDTEPLFDDTDVPVTPDKLICLSLLTIKSSFTADKRALPDDAVKPKLPVDVDVNDNNESDDTDATPDCELTTIGPDVDDNDTPVPPFNDSDCDAVIDATPVDNNDNGPLTVLILVGPLYDTTSKPLLETSVVLPTTDDK